MDRPAQGIFTMSRMDMVRQVSAPDDVPGGLSVAQRNLGPRGGAGAGEPQPKNLPLIFWRGRWIILLCAVLALGGGFYYLSKQTPIFAASSRILVESSATRIINVDLSNNARSANYLATQCELIQSPQILTAVTELPELRSMKTFTGVDNPMGVLRYGLSAMPGQKDDLITVTYESAYPEEAATIANAVIQSYEAYYANRQKSTAAGVLRVLTAEKRKADEELVNKTKEMLEYKRANPTLSYAGEKGNIVIDQLVKLSDAATTARLDAIEAKGLFEAAAAMQTDPARMEQWLRLQRGNGQGSPLQFEVDRLEIDLASLRTTKQFLPDSHTTKNLEARIAILKERIAAEAKESFDAYLDVLNQKAAAAQARQAQMELSFAEQQRRAMELNTQGAQYALMESDARRLEKLCDVLDSRTKEVRISDQADIINITVLEHAKAGAIPVRPKRGLVLFEALLLGIALGCGLSYLRDLTDQRLSSVEEVQTRLGLNILGALPHMPGGETPSVRGQKVQLDPMSDVAESYRTIRTAIYFGAPEGKTKRILVTSPAPGDGKTTSASNLAIAMAQAGQRVLLMDCDFRKPMQHRIFGIEDGIGMTNVVAGQIPLGKAIKATSTKGLYVLPSGPTPQNPSEILNGHAFAQIVARLEEKFDHIVFDSPPVMPVTDARILGASCDLTVLVLRAQKSTRRLSEHAVNSMLSVGSRILGVIVNDVPRRKDGYGYGYYSYGSYRYGNTGKRSAAAHSQALEGRTDGARLPANATSPAAAAAGGDNGAGNGDH
jgi:polysaccharide biosynthesis transport protein